MAGNRINYSPSSSGGIHLANAVRYVVLAQQEIARAKAMADSITVGGSNQANLDNAVEFGAPGASVGAVLYSAMVTLNTNLGNVTISQLGNLDPGG
jgi:hypothetical protein